MGIDLVEVAPDYDHSGSTAILAAQILLNFLGFVCHARAERISQQRTPEFAGMICDAPRVGCVAPGVSGINPVIFT